MDKKRPIEYFAKMDALMPLFREQLELGKSVRFSPRGISMLPMLRQGIDSVELSPITGKLKKYDLPLYQRKNGQYVLHRILQAGDTYTCIGDNQYEYESGLEFDQMIGVVTVFYRDEKRWSVKNPVYKLYCRFWHYTRPLRYFFRRAMGWLRRHLR